MRSRASGSFGSAMRDQLASTRSSPASRRGRRPCAPHRSPRCSARPHAATSMASPSDSATICAMRCAAWPSPKIGGRCSRQRRAPARPSNASGSTPTIVFQPASHRVDPLGLLAQRHAPHAPQVGLALDAARVGRDRLRAALELEHARVRDGIDQLDVRGNRDLPLGDARARARVHREDHRPR